MQSPDQARGPTSPWGAPAHLHQSPTRPFVSICAQLSFPFTTSASDLRLTILGHALLITSDTDRRPASPSRRSPHAPCAQHPGCLPAGIIFKSPWGDR